MECERIESEKLDVRGKTINQVMRWFYDNQLYVNRRYQRKLVWTLEEKKLFIDSIINKFPTPSIILVHCLDIESGQETFEIIDGLQRLNAIVSFINTEFSVDYNGKSLYFDPTFIPTANQQLINGSLRKKKDVLPAKICNDIADFELPIVLTSQSAEKIEQIFSRINSYGRKLSKHDLRQSSFTGELPDLVRRISANIRGDSSFKDQLLLQDMPIISLDNDNMGYGIDSSNVFWRKHDIIPFANLRQSKDEEIVAELLGKILLKEKFSRTSQGLDNLYKDSSIVNLDIDNLQNIFKIIIGQIDDIFDSVQSTFSKYLFNKKRSSNKDIAFEILFNSLYKLYIENYIIEDYKAVAEKLRDSKETVFGVLVSNKNINTTNNIENFTETLYNNLKNVFIKKSKRCSTKYDKFLENLLSLSKIESQLVEFKIGITDFKTDEVNKNVIHKISKIVVGMANTANSYNTGYLIVGIADNDISYENWKLKYNAVGNSYGGHIITGIGLEAINLSGSLDRYYRHFCDLLKNEPISSDLKNYILSNCKIISFMDKDLILIPVVKQQTESTYEDNIYVREGNSTKLKSN